MSTGLSEAAAYGYVSILIAKSPSVHVLADLVENNERIDLQQIVAKGIISSDYLKLSRYEDIESIDMEIDRLYIDFFKELTKYLPQQYSRYVEIFTEIFDIDKIAVMIVTPKEFLKKPKQVYTKSSQLLLDFVISRSGGEIDYVVCFKSSSTVECIFETYLNRLFVMLKNISRLIDIKISMHMLYLFTLLRLYSYVLNERKLKNKISISLENLIKKYQIPNHIIDKFSKCVNYIENEFSKNASFITIYEARIVGTIVKDVLLYSSSLIDKLTYLLITKFYEAKLMRYIATKKILW